MFWLICVGGCGFINAVYDFVIPQSFPIPRKLEYYYIFRSYLHNANSNSYLFIQVGGPCSLRRSAVFHFFVINIFKPVTRI